MTEQPLDDLDALETLASNKRRYKVPVLTTTLRRLIERLRATEDAIQSGTEAYQSWFNTAETYRARAVAAEARVAELEITVALLSDTEAMRQIHESKAYFDAGGKGKTLEEIKGASRD
jgi:hypothetical protein